MDISGRSDVKMTDFYVTLLSNSSKSYFPSNTTANFTTQLPRSVHLDGGNWHVALTELQFPCSLTTVNAKENLIYIKKLKNPTETGDQHNYEMLKTKIEPGNYNRIEDLISALNSNTLLINKVTFKINKPVQKKIAITIQDKSITELTMSPNLCLQLGFEPWTNLCLPRESHHPANVLLGLPSQMFVYCDIIEPQIISDVLAKVLRIAVVDSRKYVYGTQHAQLFPQPHYVPVLKREFENIEIDIRTNTGERVPFLFGTVCVKLHFKKLN